jgi:hypothetical protein
MTRYLYKPKRSTLKLYDFMCSSLRFLHIVSYNFVQTFSIFLSQPVHMISWHVDKFHDFDFVCVLYNF